MQRLRKILVGHGQHNHRSRPAIKNQIFTVLRIWRNYDHLDFGIERIVRLLLAVSQFASISLYIKQLTGRFGQTTKKLSVEIYVLLKLIFPLLAMHQGWTTQGWYLPVIFYLINETIIYLLTLIFISDATREFIQPRRSFLLLFINFMEMTFAFASMYLGSSQTHIDSFSKSLGSTTDAIYFSFVTATTTGFGDFYPVSNLNKWLVISQSAITFLFVALFINYFTNLLQHTNKFQIPQRFTKTKHQHSK